MEPQNNTESWKQSTIGTEEAQKLEPKEVKIVAQELVVVGKDSNKYEKIVFSCKHPDREEPLNISDVKYIFGDKVVNRATWYKLDSKGGILKDSALALLMTSCGAKVLGDLVGKTVKTAVDDKGYLCLKAY